MMGDFRVHHIRFFEHTPNAIHCLAYDDTQGRLAVSRSDGSIEVWSVNDNWYQERTFAPSSGQSVEAVIWCRGRLFSAGLHGEIHEHDLVTLTTKSSASSNSGPIWCLTKNQGETKIAAGTEDGCVVIFDVTEEGAKYSRAFSKQQGRILSLAWYESGTDNLIISGGADNIRVWNCQLGQAIQRLTLGRIEKNKETIVWALAVTSDFTIISGDSTGKTCFWNGKQGTLVKSYQAHKADVLTVCASKDGMTCFSSGVDPTLAQFEYIPTNPDSDWKMWVRSTLRSQHTHDVRAVTLVGDCVVSGGVDCQLILNHLKAKKGIKKWRRIGLMPSASLVHTAPLAKCVLLQYPNYLELWRLGSTNKNSEKNNVILPLAENQIKVLQLNSRGEDIVCSATSLDAKWIAYSDSKAIRLFKLTMEDVEVAPPRVTVNRVQYLPPGTLPAHCMTFTPDGAKLVTVTCQGTVQVLAVDGIHPSLLATLQPKTGITDSSHLLTISHSGKYAAIGDHSNNVHIFNLEKQQHHCSLPRYSHQPTALAFHPSSHLIVVAYSDQTMREYNYHRDSREYTDWSRNLSRNIHPQWLKRHSKITQAMYNVNQPDQILVRDEQMFCIIDKTQELPSSSDELFNKRDWAKDVSTPASKHAFHICSRFKYLLHVDILEDNYMVVVERPPLAITESLPATLKQKKFGT